MEAWIDSIDTYFNGGIIHSSITILIILFFTLFINYLLNSFINRRFTHNIQIIKRIKKGILWIIAILCILLQIKPMESIVAAIVASGGILAITIGLASQEAASGVINGMMILISKPYKVGDHVFIVEHNVRGKVLDITLRHTVIETLEKTQMLIPNATMNKTVIENISNVPNKKGNYLFVDISYESDMDKAIHIIQELAMQHPYFLDPRTKKEKEQKLPAVSVYCLEFKAYSISLRASVYSKDSATGFDMLSDLRKRIKQRFDEEGICIPYPHYVVSNKEDR